MTHLRYICIASAAYMAAFLAVFLILDSWPVQPFFEAVGLIAGGSILLAWLGTFRAMQFGNLDQPPFAIPTLVHGLFISLLIGGAIYIRLSSAL